MRIRLKQNLRVEANHGCTRGTTWEVEAIITGKKSSRCPRYLFMSDAGQMLVALADEAEVVDRKRGYEKYSYEHYYKQPEGADYPRGEDDNPS